jgi:hypothetical protein
VPLALALRFCLMACRGLWLCPSALPRRFGYRSLCRHSVRCHSLHRGRGWLRLATVVRRYCLLLIMLWGRFMLFSKSAEMRVGYALTAGRHSHYFVWNVAVLMLLSGSKQAATASCWHRGHYGRVSTFPVILCPY